MATKKPVRSTLAGASALSRRGLWILVGLVAAGTAIRIAVAFASYGIAFDQRSFELVSLALRDDGFGVYDLPPERWPYPTLFLPFVRLADKAAFLTGLPFHGWIQVPAIIADAVIALLIQHWLRLRGAGERKALAGAALVALGPSFMVVSGYHGQIDSVAILPAVLGVYVWERRGRHRALWAGLLIGAGAAVKPPPAFTALALLGTARSWRERLTVLTATGTVPLASVAPWLIGDLKDTVAALTYNKGVGGLGGVSGFVNPDLTRYWGAGVGEREASELLVRISEYQNLMVFLAVLAVGLLLLIRRVPPLPGLVALWLAVFVANPNFSFTYLIWGLPFFLLAGHVRAVAIFQVAILPATVLLYGDLHSLEPTGWGYLVAVQAAWLGLVGAAVLAVRACGPADAPQSGCLARQAA